MRALTAIFLMLMVGEAIAKPPQAPPVRKIPQAPPVRDISPAQEVGYKINPAYLKEQEKVPFVQGVIGLATSVPTVQTPNMLFRDIMPTGRTITPVIGVELRGGTSNCPT